MVKNKYPDPDETIECVSSFDNFLLMPDYLFDKAVKRWEETDKSLLDILIVPVLEAMNKHKNIATVWSCSGHFEKDRYETSGHVIVAVNNSSGIEYLLKIISCMNNWQSLNEEGYCVSFKPIFLLNFLEKNYYQNLLFYSIEFDLEENNQESFLEALEISSLELLD